MPITVLRDSTDTHSISVSPSYTDMFSVQQLVGSDKPLPTEDVNHLRLQEGRAYCLYVTRNNGNKLAAGASLDIAVAFASGVYPHIVATYLCGGSAEFYIYEGSTVSNGTAGVTKKRNRSSTIASQSASTINPTVSSIGTELFAGQIITGQGSGSSGGAAGIDEYVLSPLTTYLFRVTNRSNTAEIAQVHLDWYE
jgi:hypothetical protein